MSNTDLEKRVRALEEENKLLKSQIEQSEEVFLRVTSTIEAMHNTIASCVDWQNKQTSQGNNLMHILQQQSHNISFVTLVVYWLCHVLERVENVMPNKTVDLILNSTEESMNPKDSTFYKLFDQLR